MLVRFCFFITESLRIPCLCLCLFDTKKNVTANRTSATRLERIGTFYGQASDDYREVNTAQEISTYFIPGGCRAFGPGRINYFFKFAGPSYSIDSACSSSLATIQVRF